MLKLLRWIGLFWQLLLPALLAIVLAVGAVQVWTLRVSQTAIRQQMQDNVDASMAVMEYALAPLGTEWSRRNGELRLGSTPVATQEAILSSVTAITGGVATIFSGDERVATTVKKPDGSPAIGTKLDVLAIRQAVLIEGKSFRGTAPIVGKTYVTLYQPIRDRDGAIIGILFTGLSTEKLKAAEGAILQQASLAGALVIMLFGLVLTGLMRRSLRPLNALTQATQEISGGNFAVEICGIDRSDQIGRLAQSLEGFRATGVQVAQMEAERSERRRAEAERGAQRQGGSRAGGKRASLRHEDAGGRAGISRQRQTDPSA